MRPARTVLACLAAGATAFAIAGITADVQGRRAVDRLIASHGGLSVATVTVNPLSGRLTLGGIVATGSGLQVRIATLSVPMRGASFIASAQAGSGSQASADGIVIHDGPTTYLIKHVELDGTSLTNGELAALLDPQSGETIEARVRKMTASAISIPEIKADSVVGASEQHWTQKQVLFANVMAGKAASGSAGAATLAVTDGKRATNVEIGGVEMTGIDLGQIARVLNAARTDPDEPLRPLYDTVVANAIKVTDVSQNQAITVGSVKEEGVRGRPITGGLRARSVEFAQTRPNGAAATAFVNDLLSALAARSVEMDDLASVPPATGAAASATVRLTQFKATDLGGGRTIGSVAVQDLRVNAASGAFTLANVKASGIGFAASADPNAESIPTVDDFAATGLDVDVKSGEADQPPQRFAFKVASLNYAAPGYADGKLPPKARESMSHLTLAVQPNGPAGMLHALGYDHLDISSDAASTYDREQGTLSIDRFAISDTDMGSVVLKLGLANVSDKVASRDPALQQASVIAMLFKSADLTLRNGTIVERMLRYQAGLTGRSLDAQRQVTIDLVANQLPAQLGDPPKLKPLAAALGRFIAEPKTLHIAVSSRNGLGAADAGLLGDPLALIDQLDIQASANE